MINLVLSLYPNLLEVLATYWGVEVACLLDSASIRSFVHPCVVSTTSVATSKSTKLTIILVNGNKVVCDNLVKTGLVFVVQDNKMHQATTAIKLYWMYC